jgi:hypothetical protein
MSRMAIIRRKQGGVLIRIAAYAVTGIAITFATAWALTYWLVRDFAAESFIVYQTPTGKDQRAWVEYRLGLTQWILDDELSPHRHERPGIVPSWVFRPTGATYETCVTESVGLPFESLYHSRVIEIPANASPAYNWTAHALNVPCRGDYVQLPIGIRWPAFAGNVLAWAAFAALVHMGSLELRRRLGARPGACPDCNYDRAGLAADAKCPECGTATAAR